MTVDEIIKHCDDYITGMNKYADTGNIGWWLEFYHTVLNGFRELKALEEQQPRWIPIKTRPMTEEEKEEIGHEYAYMYDCPLPDDGQEVLITDWIGNVEIDTFCRDYEGCYFENNCDDGEAVAWMPKPQPYKAESEEDAE